MSSIDFSLGGANFSIPTSELIRDRNYKDEILTGVCSLFSNYSKQVREEVESLKKEAEAEGKLVNASFFSDLLEMLKKQEEKVER